MQNIKRILKGFHDIEEYTQVGPKILHNGPSRGIRTVKFFLAYRLSE